MERTEQRVFTLLCFYAAAIPLLILGVVVVHEGWGANPNSVRRQCFLYLCFLLGVAGVVVNDTDVGLPALFAIVFAMIAQSLLLLCLPIMKGCRLRLIGMGIVTLIGPIPLTAAIGSIAKDQLNIRSRDAAGELSIIVIFTTAIVLSLLALFRLRHGWIAEEAKRKVGWLGNALQVLNLFAPIGLYVLAMGLTDGGLRDEEWLLLVPGWLFAAGLALMALGRGVGDLQPIKPLRGTGEMSFLVGAGMLSMVFLIQENPDNKGLFYNAVEFGLIFLAFHHVTRGFVSRWVRDSVQRFLFKWTVRGVPALIVLAIVGVSAYYALGKTMANSALPSTRPPARRRGGVTTSTITSAKSRPMTTTFTWPSRSAVSCTPMKVGEKPVYLNPTIKTNGEAVIGKKRVIRKAPNPGNALWRHRLTKDPSPGRLCRPASERRRPFRIRP